MQAIKCISDPDPVCGEWLMCVTGVVVGDGAVGKVGARNATRSYLRPNLIFRSDMSSYLIHNQCFPGMCLLLCSPTAHILLFLQGEYIPTGNALPL
jgi:hypothetical protein